jgi:hypothetical protein
MLAGALGFSTAAAGRRDLASVAPDEEQWALGSVLRELGTGLFQLSGGSSQSVFGSRRRPGSSPIGWVVLLYTTQPPRRSTTRRVEDIPRRLTERTKGSEAIRERLSRLGMAKDV